MKKFMMLLLVLLLSGCAVGIPMQPTGLISQDVKAPLTNVAYYGATTPTVSKMGTSSCSSILGLFAFGNAEIYKAMQNGGITKVNQISYRLDHMLFIYLRYTIIVYGE